MSWMVARLQRPWQVVPSSEAVVVVPESSMSMRAHVNSTLIGVSIAMVDSDVDRMGWEGYWNHVDTPVDILLLWSGIAPSLWSPSNTPNAGMQVMVTTTTTMTMMMMMTTTMTTARLVT
jgi:hypothetical protein